MSDWWSADPVAEAPKQSPYGGAISSIESGGNYRAIGPVTRTGDRALGKYQVMGQNVGPWTEEILGRRMTPREFLMDDDAQEKVFEGKFGQYRQKHGEEGAARAWLAGEGGMNDLGRRDQLGTSVADYSRKFTGALGYADEGPRTAQRAAPQATEVSAQSKTDWWKADPVAQDNVQQSSGIRAGREGDLDAQPAKSDISIGASVLHGAGQGLTAQFGDEIGAAMDVPVSALIGGKFGEEYEKNLAARRERSKAAEEANPGAFLTGNVVGAVVSPAGRVGMATRGATMGARALGAAKGGAVYGGLSGAGAGEDLESRATGAATGAAIGGTVGAVASPVVDVAGKGLSAAGRAVTSPVSAARAYLNPERAAGQVVAGTVREAERIGDPTRIARPELQRLAAAGEPVSTMELAGKPGRELARMVKNEPRAQEGGSAVQTMTAERSLSQGVRFADDVERLSVGTRRVDLEDLKHAAAPTNSANYKAAHQQSEHIIAATNEGLLTPTFRRLLQSPIAQQALGPAAQREANRTIVEGAQRARQFPITIDKKTGSIAVRESASGKSSSVFDLHAVDAISRGLRDAQGAAARAGNNELSRDITILRNAWLKEADSQVPAYAKARGEAYKFFKAEDAFEAGQNFAKRTGKLGDREMAQARAEIAKMTASERELFRRGGGQELAQRLRSLPENRDVTLQILNSPAAREQMELMLGAAATRRLEARRRVEQIMEYGKTAVSGNSSTAFQLNMQQAGAGALAGAGGYGYGLVSGDNPFSSAAVFGALGAGNKRLKMAVNAKVLDKVGKMLASNDPAQYERAMNAIAKNEKLFNAVRQISGNLERAGAGTTGGQLSGSVPAVSMPRIGRAEEEQP